mgnify:CR=1 FL=1
MMSLKLVILSEVKELEAISRYTLQSFAPNAVTKGFPLLSGLGLQ